MSRLFVSLFALAALARGAFAAIDPADILGYWKFDGTTEADQLKNEVGGNANPLVFSATGRGYITIANGVLTMRKTPNNSGILNTKNSLGSPAKATIEMWVRNRTASTSCFALSGMGTATANFDGLVYNQPKWAVQISSVGTVTASASVNNSWNHCTATAANILGDYKWHHIAIVFDGSIATATERLNVYVDGALATVTRGTAGASATIVLSYLRFSGGDCQVADLRVSKAVVAPTDFLAAPSIDVPTQPATTATWTGGAGDRRWANAANWKNNTLPVEGQDVYLSEKATVLVDCDTTRVGALVSDGFLVFSNATARLNAESITLGTFAFATAFGPFGTAATNHVRFACADFTMPSRAVFDLNSRGYPASTGPGYKNENAGVSHGGFGYYCAEGKPPYGNAAEPTTPGSGGRGGAGGGIVAIRATGTVTLAGRILANGGVGGDCRSAGSGGSILVTADKLVLAGAFLSACGGDPGNNDSHAGYQNAPGAGGRIALRYATVETTGDVPFAVRALGGRPYSKGGVSNGGYAFATTGAENHGYSNWRAGAGTIYLSDNTLQDEFGGAIAGVIVNVPSVVWSGGHTITNWVGFADDGCSVTCTGDLTLDGRDGRLDLGVATDGALCGKYGYHDGKVAQALSVWGNLKIVNSARLDVRAASTNAPEQVGARVKVGGRLLISTNSFLRTYCHQISGSVPVFEAGSFAVLTNGVVDARWSGWGAGKGPGCNNTAYVNSRQGGSYGGKGGITTSSLVPDRTYGLAERPYYPGSGSYKVPGGGFFYLKTEGTALVDGKILASGVADGEQNGTAASSSGGGVLIDCKTFAGAGSITANGGEAQNSWGKHCGGGGGGRIAVYVGSSWQDKYLRWSWLVKWFDAPGAAATTEKGLSGWKGSATAAGGTCTMAAGTAGEDGTVVFGICPPRGFKVILR